jgi:mercuric ion binding protein
MKLKLSLLTFILLLTSFSFAKNDQPNTATFHVDKMTCATCPIAVKKAMQRVDGVESIDINFDSKKAVVIYNADVTNPQAIADAATNVGFSTQQIDEQ